MTQPGFTINVIVSGPMFGGTFAAEQPLFGHPLAPIIGEFLREAERRVAEQGLAEVHQLLDRYIKHPTPYYETQIMVQQLQGGGAIVHDRGIIYGPWLEGISRRNQTTRFKGYASFRKGTQALRARVPALIQYTLNHYLPRMGGRGGI
jgi:hypothetical protein